MVNIGWLGASCTFEPGLVDPSVRDRLLRLAAQRRNLMRGFHNCEMCSMDSPIEVPSSWASSGIQYLGNGEIHVPSTSGVIFSAPTLVIHYIDSHGYCPPQEFLDAVREVHFDE